MTVISPKMLIEVALPLDAINDASIRESYIYRGNPSALHKWWAQRPLAAARAVIFAQLVHDPEDLWRCQNPREEPNQQVRGHWTKARAKLFKIIEDLVLWENTTNETVLKPAREAIRQSWRDSCELNKGHPKAKELFNPDQLPGLHDPFAGGGTIPLEAQRLGLEAFASDLNPVAVLINKAMIEIPPNFAGMPPVHPDSTNPLMTWSGSAGLAEDVRRYGQWMRDEAFNRIGRFYPPINITKAMVKDRPDLKPYEGEKLTVIAWLWARTVKSPNPAFSHVDVPLASTFILSSKSEKEAFVRPVIENGSYRFVVQYGKPTEAAKSGTKAARGGNFRCLMSSTPIDPTYIRSEGVAGRMSERLMAIVATGPMGRVYLDPDRDLEAIAKEAKPNWYPEGKLVEKHRAFTPTIYGLTKWSDLFTSRQLVAMTTFADLVQEARQRVLTDAVASMKPSSGDQNSILAEAYADAVATYLALSLSKVADYNCSLVPWYTKEDRPGHLFSKQAIPIVWDYAELNPLTDIGGTLEASFTIVSNALAGCCPLGVVGDVTQLDVLQLSPDRPRVISTDPPYYDKGPFPICDDARGGVS